MARPAARIHDTKYAAVLARGSQFHDRKIINPVKSVASGLSMGLTREEALVLNLVRQLGADGVLLQAAPLAKILIGASSKDIRQYGSSPFNGKLRGQNRKDVVQIINGMISKRLLTHQRMKSSYGITEYAAGHSESPRGVPATPSRAVVTPSSSRTKRDRSPSLPMISGVQSNDGSIRNKPTTQGVSASMAAATPFRAPRTATPASAAERTPSATVTTPYGRRTDASTVTPPMNLPASDSAASDFASGPTAPTARHLVHDAPPSPSDAAAGTEDLSAEQQAVLQLVLRGKNVFFTGSAGTGKSFLLRRLIGRLRARYGEAYVHITASTGIAACNIGGITLHSFAGLRRDGGTVAEVARRVSHQAKTRWRMAQVLIVDEISMLDAPTFDMVEGIARHVRNSGEPFGGLQLVLCGDFFQLPPVPDRSSGHGNSGQRSFAFQAAAWSKCVDVTVKFVKVFRQKHAAFIRVLNQIREGVVTEEAKALLASAGSRLRALDSIVPTKLFPRNNAVDSYNQQRLDALEGEVHTWRAIDSGVSMTPQQAVGLLNRGCTAPQELQLKVGAQVVMLANRSDQRVFNGSRGVVVGFEKPTEDSAFKELPVVQFETANGSTTRVPVLDHDWTISSGRTVLASRIQIPLKLAWAFSVHKSQGMTIEHLEVNFDGTFEYGQAYVALSRAAALETLLVRNFSARVIKAHPAVVAFYKQLQTGSDAVRLVEAQGEGGGTQAGSDGSGDAEPAVVKAKPFLKPIRLRQTTSGHGASAQGGHKRASPADVDGGSKPQTPTSRHTTGSTITPVSTPAAPPAPQFTPTCVLIDVLGDDTADEASMLLTPAPSSITTNTITATSTVAGTARPTGLGDGTSDFMTPRAPSSGRSRLLGMPVASPSPHLSAAQQSVVAELMDGLAAEDLDFE